MRIMWVTNVAIPEIAADAGIKKSYGGGWLVQLSKQLADENKLAIVFPSGKSSLSGCVNELQYYSIPRIKTVDDLNSERFFERCVSIIKEYQPDVIHIWGTEFLHSSLFFNAAKSVGMEKKVIISLQGLLSEIIKYYWGYIQDPLIKLPTLKEAVRKTGIGKQYKDFLLRAEYEKDLLRKAENVIGRTDWDKECVKRINPAINYYHCDETMRESFYGSQWSYDSCEKNTLFISQGYYPLKGLHLALEALAIVRKYIPDIKLYVSGRKPIDYSLHAKLREKRYDRYIRRLIEKYSLQENVEFVGWLSEEEMCKQFLSANVFLSPSTIENSSNSIAEAMLLGVPVIASNAGGTSTFVKHLDTGMLYEAEKISDMADYIVQLLGNADLQRKISEREKQQAHILFSPSNNYRTMLNIYKKVISSSKSGF